MKSCFIVFLFSGALQQTRPGNDKTGGNSDRWPIAPGAVQEVFNATGPGVITHIWFTIAARGELAEPAARAELIALITGRS